MSKLNTYFGVCKNTEYEINELGLAKYTIYISKDKDKLSLESYDELQYVFDELADEFGIIEFMKNIYGVNADDMDYEDICKVLIFKGFIHSNELDACKK